MKILVLEPYYGGSHKAFLQGMEKHLPAEFTLLTLPARKWKWRMRLAAPCFAEKLRKDGGSYDAVLCSTFVDVAALRALAPDWLNRLPVLTYFHENQFVYPVRRDDERDYHFAVTNITTALASDRLAFNSAHNLETFLAGAGELLRKAPDMKLGRVTEKIRAKSIVLPPGIDFSVIDSTPPAEGNEIPVIVWNHRWEHDKNPGLFFESLYSLDQEGADFSLLVLGQSFAQCPAVFAEAAKRLASRTIHSGYVRSRKQYASLLRQGDIVVSTADHEFFGMAVLEAVRAGCRPLLPARLSYPEMIPAGYLYNDDEFAGRLAGLLKNGRLDNRTACSLTERYSWPSLAGRYMEWFAGSLGGGG